MRKCENCGNELRDEEKVCSNCGTESVSSVPSVLDEKKTDKKKKLMICGIGIILIAVCVFGILVKTHIICFKHEWKEATCTKPQICSKCNREKGEPLGHSWEEATCTEPMYCSVCKKEKGEPLGHTEGDWEIASKATLNEDGYSEKTCEVCDEVIETKDITKVPKVLDESFNFEEKEFIEYANNVMNDKYSISAYSLEANENSNGYPLCKNGEMVAVIFLTRDINDLIKGIMILAEDDNEAIILGVYLGTLIDKDDDTDTLVKNIVIKRKGTKNGINYSYGKMNSYYGVILTPENLKIDE